MPCAASWGSIDRIQLRFATTFNPQEVGMKLAARLTTPTCLVFPLFAGLVLAGCGTTQQLYAPTPTQVALLSEAQLDYDVAPTERPPKDTTDRAFPPGHSVPDDDAPNMTIATMTLKPGHPPARLKLIARITSNRDFAPMGIQRGMNYVWRDTLTRAAWITPRSGPDHHLVETPGYQFASRPEHQPSLLRVAVNSFAFVLCLDDCPTGHCGMY
jgi:hypothetical protein